MSKQDKPVCEWNLTDEDWAKHKHGISVVQTPAQAKCAMCGKPIKWVKP